jgi:opacity protein-like surface antigen
MTGITLPTFGVIVILLSEILFASRLCLAQEPRVAAKGPIVSVSIGYAYLNSEIPSVGRISENGVATGIAADFTDRFGIKLESSYTRTYGAFGLPHHSDVLAVMAGPVIYPVRRPRFAMYAEGLVGGTRIEGVVPENNGSFLLVEVKSSAWAVGAGVETPLTRSTVLRTGVDYLRARYLTPERLVSGQGNTRVTVSLVYTFGKVRR